MFDETRVVGLPEGITEMVPGPELARLLGSIDRHSLIGYDRVLLMKARSRQVAHEQAHLYADMVSVFQAEKELIPDLNLDEVYELTVAEIRSALTLTRRSAELQVDFARQLVEDYPGVWSALSGGIIDVPKARVLVHQTCHLDPEIRERVVEVALERASTQTTGLLAARIRRLAIWVDPDSARKRYMDGIEARRVASEANDDGTANMFGLQLPAAATQAVMRRINRLARAAKSRHDLRTMDQIRADVFLDLLQGTGGHHRGRDRAVIDIRVDLATLTGLSESPGEIPGWGPVISDIARQVVAEQPEAEHRVTVIDDTGAMIWNGTTRRRPTAAQRRRIQARSPICAFPGCRMPADECDIDHNEAWADGGRTVDGNLAPLCRHDHVIRHLGWSVIQTRPGAYRLTSPLGHNYETGPDPPVPWPP
jgi:hypothetical protein